MKIRAIIRSNLTIWAATLVSLVPLTLSVEMQQVQALSLPKKASTVTPSESLLSSSSFKIAQSSPVQGQWKLRYSVTGVVYESILRMEGYSGVMLTRFFDVNTKSTAIVQQTMRLRSSPKGLVILGYNPVYPGTKTSYPRYSPDNFLFQIRPDGSLLFATCDDAMRCSPVEIVP